MAKWKDIPNAVRGSIKRQMAKSDIEREDVLEEFESVIQEVKEKYRNDSQFDTKEKRRIYAGKVVYGKLLRGRVGAEGDYSVIPLGYGTVRDEGKKVNVVGFIRNKENNRGAEFNWILIDNKSSASRIGNISLFAKYELELSSWQGGYITDGDGFFSRPERISDNPKSLLSRITIPDINYQTIDESFSEKEQGFPIATDWRHWQGLIVGEPVCNEHFGIYKVVDETAQKKQVESKTGDTYGPGHSVFCHPAQMQWQVDSVCDFYGTTSLSNKSGLPVMNAHLIQAQQAIPKTKSG